MMAQSSERNLRIDRVAVYGLDESVKASKYPKSVDVNECTSEITDTTRKLGSCDMGTGHDNYLNGIIVQFDLTLSIKAWVEAERYHFLEFVSSQSTMHKIVELSPRKQCNEYVEEDAIRVLERRIAIYNADPTPDNYLRVLYNVPTGFELTARMSTDYRQLKTIYHQRRFHRLPEWKEVCKWIESLPHFKELCLGGAG